jgi:diguanylate cyclase (GGDEF)-like protein/PAS domain S-box-containing protein
MSERIDARKIRRLFDSHPDLICQWLENGELTYINDTYCNFFNKPYNELIDQSHLENIHPDDREKLLSHIKKFDSKQKNARIILRLINNGGDIRWYQFIDHYQFNERFHQGEIFSTGRDISDFIKTEKELQYRVKFEQLVTKLSVNFINAPTDDIDDHINELLAEVGKLIDVDRSYVFTLDQENGTISNAYEWCNDGIEPQIDTIQGFSTDELKWWMPRLYQFEVINIPNIAEMPPEAAEEKKIFLKQGIKSLLNVPLVNAGKLLGFLGFDSVKEMRNWSEDEVTILRIVGGIVGSAILQKKSQQELKQRTHYLENLNEITVASLNTSNLKEMLRVLAEKMGNIIHADYCTITLWDEKRKEMSTAVSNGIPKNKLSQLIHSSNKMSMSYSVLSAGKPVIVEDAINLPHAWKDVVNDLNAKALLGIPMKSAQSIIGTIIFGFTSSHQFTDDEIALVQQAANQISQSIEKVRLLEQAKRNEQAATRLHKAGAIVASTLKPDLAIELILDQLERVVPFDSASVQILEEGYVEVRAGKGWPDGFNPVGLRFEIPGDNPNTVVIETQKPYVLNEANKDFEIFEDLELEIKSWLGIPLIVHDDVIGMLTLDHHQPSFYDDERIIDLVMAFADQVAISLENARLYANEHQRVKELDALRATTADITRELSLENLIRSILERATILLGATGGELGLLDKKDGSIRILVSHNMGSENTASLIQPGEGLMGYVVQTKQVEMIENYQDWEGSMDKYKKSPIFAAIGAPLMIGERILGVIGIMNSDRKRTFSSSDKDLMRLFAQQAAIAVGNAQLFEEKERQARIDVTTDIFNRRGLLELGKRELDRAHRYERPLAALMIDIDRFKQVNDTHGHAIGDLVLKELAEILNENIRTIDVLGRYGGEEFVILLPETTPETAFEIAERLREKVSNHTFTPESLELHITISIGLAFSTGKNNGLNDLIKRADEAMYMSKGAGRNQTSLFPSS